MTLIQLMQAGVPVPLINRVINEADRAAATLRIYNEIVERARDQGLPIDNIITEVLRDA